MSFKKNIKQRLFNSPQGVLFFYKFRILREKWTKTTLNDNDYIKKDYRKRFGREINLKNPQGFAEKMQWLKLFYRNDQMPVCSDKYDLRLFLKKYGYDHLLNEVLAVYETNEQIDKMDIENLPQSFVVKATHGSSWNLIVKDKDQINWKLWKKIFKIWLKFDLSVFGREWNYREVKPRIMIEKFINHQPLFDYKFAFFNNDPGYIQVTSKKNGKEFIDYFDAEWNKFDLTASNLPNANFLIEKPPAFEQMMKIGKDLSKIFPFARIDFYNFENTIILGEITFFPGGGFPFDYSSKEMDLYFGSILKIPSANYNLHILQKL